MGGQSAEGGKKTDERASHSSTADAIRHRTPSSKQRAPCWVWGTGEGDAGDEDSWASSEGAKTADGWGVGRESVS